MIDGKVSTEKITFPDGEWWEIKDELTMADAAFLQEKLKDAGVTGLSEMDAHAVNVIAAPFLERISKGWSFSTPLTVENIAEMRSRYRMTVLTRFFELNAKSGEWSKN